ncbi:MAG: threonine/serine exporter family protein [Erysipelotrichaceae bacterium]
MEKLNVKQQEKLAQLLLKMGENCIYSGAEIKRVEDMINFTGYSYGANNVNVFVITSCIILTLNFDDNQVTTTKRIKQFGYIDLTRLEQLNALSRKVCKNPLDVDKLEAEVNQIVDRKQNMTELFVGDIVSSGAFALFFGGNIYDVIFASLVGILVFLMQKYIEPICMNSMIFKFVGCFITGLITCFLAYLIPQCHQDILTIAEVMLFIPGVMFTNSLRDTLLGDTLSGALRFIEATLLAGAVVFGFFGSMYIFKGLFIV